MSKPSARRSKSIRALITVGSLFGFVGAWGLFAHASKPASTQVAPLLEPLPTPRQLQLPINQSGSVRQAESLPTIPSQQTLPIQQRARLRTGGS